MNALVIRSAKMLATGLERLLAFGILLGVITFAFESVVALTRMDWSSTETFYELIYRSLLLVISVELIRTLVTHDLMAVLELLAFVVARKMLKPELATIDILLASPPSRGFSLPAASSFRHSLHYATKQTNSGERLSLRPSAWNPMKARHQKLGTWGQ